MTQQEQLEAILLKMIGSHIRTGEWDTPPKEFVKEEAAAITALIQEARIEELKRVGCCDYWEDGCDLNVCNGEQLDRIKQLSGGSNNE